MLGGLFGVCPLLFSSQLNDPTRYPQFLGLLLVLILVVGLGLRDRNPKAGIALPKAIWVLLGGWIGLHLVSLTQAINLPEGMFETVQAVAMVLLFLVLLRFFQEKDGWNELAMVVVVAAGLQAAIGLAQTLGIDLPGLAKVGLATGTHANPNQLGSACMMMLPLVIWAILRLSAGWKVAGALVAAMLVGVMFYTGSRAVWLGLVLMSLVAILWVMPVLWRREGMRRWFWVGIGVGVGSFLVIYMGFREVGGRKGGSYHYEYLWEEDAMIQQKHNSLEYRFIVWNRSMDMIEDHPMLGVGAGNWKVQIPKYGIKGFDDLGRYGLDFSIRPHNDFLKAGAELGILGMVCFVGFFVAGFWLAVAGARKGMDAGEREKGFLVLLAFVGMTVAALFSFPHERIFQSTMFWTYLALAVGLWAKKHQGKSRQAGWWAPVALVVLLVCLVVTGFRIKGDAVMHRMIVAKTKKNWVLTEKEAKNAGNWSINIEPISAAPAEWYLGLAQLSMGKNADGLNSMQEAIEIAPWHLAVRANLAAALEMNRQHAEAAKAYESVLETFPDFEESWLNLAVVYLNLGQYDQVSEALEKVGSFRSDPRYQAILNNLEQVSH